MRVRIPDSYILIIYIIIILGLATYVIPSGSFNRQIDDNTGISYVIPDSYRVVEKDPVSIFNIFKAIPEGMMRASDIIIFVLLVGGSFGIINATGIIHTMIGNIARSYIGREKVIILIVMTAFSLMGAIFGMSEETLPLYPIVISLALALGFDRLTGIAMILVGTTSGFVAGFLNPFNTGIAQGIVGLPMFSGISLRIICHIIFLLSGIIFVYTHVGKINTNSNLASSNDSGAYEKVDINDFPEFTKKHKRILLVLIVSIAFLVIGIIKWKFYILEISTVFIIMGVLSGYVGGLKSGRMVSEFTKGASNIIYGALIIGLARAIMVVMEYGNILDTIIYSLSKIIGGVSPVVNSVSMFIVHGIIELFISSASGQASVTLPIMMNLADMSGVTRQTAVLAFQFGDGFANIISPTAGILMAALVLGDVDWKKWVKFIYPLVTIWVIEGIILLVISTITNYGPF